MKRILVLIALFIFYAVSYSQNNKSIDDIKSSIENQYIEFCSQLNKLLPMIVDKVTTLKSVAFVDWTMSYYYQLEIDVSDYEEAMLKSILVDIRKGQKKQIPSMVANGNYKFNQSELYEYLKGTGLKFRFVYHDINNKQIGTNEFDYKDFKVYKE